MNELKTNGKANENMADWPERLQLRQFPDTITL